MKKQNIILLLLLLFASPQMGSTIQANSDSSLKVTAEIVKQEYCLDSSPVLVQDSETKKPKEIGYTSTTLIILIKLQLKNVNSEPLIIQKDYFALYTQFIAKNLDAYHKGKFISDERISSELQFNTIEDESPPSDKFIILKSNENFTAEVTLSVDLGEGKTLIKDGNYQLGFVTAVWGGQYWAGESVRKRWKDFGYLWLKPIMPEPIPLQIKKPSKLNGAQPLAEEVIKCKNVP